MRRAFITSAPADHQFAAALTAALTEAGIVCSGHRGAVAGAEPSQADDPPADRAIMASDAVLVLWSQASARSAFARREVETAIEAWAERKLVLIRIDHSELPAGLRDLSAIDPPTDAQAGSPQAARWQAESAVRRLAERGQMQARPPLAAPAGFPMRFGWVAGAAVVALLAALVWVYVRGDWQALLAPHAVLGAGTIRQVGQAPSDWTGYPEGRAAPPPPGTTPPEDCEVFISYSTRDQPAVEALVETIAGLRHRPWIYVKSPGHDDRYAQPIVKAIRASRKVAVMCSDSAYRSDDVVRELYVAKRAKKPFVVFFIDRHDVPEALPEDFEYMLGGYPWIPVVGKSRLALEDQIRTALG